MADKLTFEQENRERIRAVENSFGPSVKPLSRPGRLLIGEGRLMKKSRRGGPQPKVFFLFNDVLVYGSIILNGRWNKKQKIIPLEDIQLQDLEDGAAMKNQWLIRTPRKSFYVGANSVAEKQAWIEHLEQCQAKLLQSSSRTATSQFAVTWIPDQATDTCMHCPNRFSLTLRRHHCRQCGFVVCRECSKYQVVIPHMHPTKPKRVCKQCYSSLTTEVEAGRRGNSIEQLGSDEEEQESFSEEEEGEEKAESHDPSSWVDPRMDSCSMYVYLKPEHTRKPVQNSHLR